MRFEKDVQDQYLTYSALGNRVAGKLSLFAKQPFLPELCDQYGSSKFTDTESLGVIDVPVNKIVGIASVCGKYSYSVDFLPIMPSNSQFAKTWCNIYYDYLNEKEISPILCYEYLGNFYVIDGKIRVSVMKCHGVSTMKANVIRVLPSNKNSEESIQYYRREFHSHRRIRSASPACQPPHDQCRASGYWGCRWDHHPEGRIHGRQWG